MSAGCRSSRRKPARSAVHAGRPGFTPRTALPWPAQRQSGGRRASQPGDVDPGDARDPAQAVAADGKQHDGRTEQVSQVQRFALRALVDRIGARILAHAELAIAETDREKRRALTTELLGELLTLDETRYPESAVWLAFATQARTSPTLRPHVREMYDGTRTLVGKVLTRSRELGGLAEHVDIAVETERLTALIDGLMTNGVIQPDRMTPDLMRTVLNAHLDSIAKI
ncbi:TetR family transcriptional regulator C-terminal domain-containing protein [Actinophytocola algeriensis]|uniref:BetI-type transcriptional repressor C-terminal domain-containing protein n=1 Tax=Actinophytocola algeriensis TaxID=1768010 RepID=A0A7W7Q5Z9_9PSEU|nr:TetR family transcriptional regulator C-terminal domain-containing protein [Actinophytocola algeriensis]MBB4907552.1 hypothetical protein [Actinophytocola algeriensis]MBE1479582.1 hypothetical protein [Actinophytocola algeriensis]